MAHEALMIIGTVAGAVISGIVSLIVAGIQHNKSMAVIEYRLEELEKKGDKHNNVVERLYKVEAQLNSK